MDALLDPEVLGNLFIYGLLFAAMFVVQKWMDKHRPRY